jgi:hypothetical protein
MFEFMLDSRDPAMLTPTILSGRVRISVSFDSLNNSFASSEVGSGGQSSIKIIGDRIKTE